MYMVVGRQYYLLSDKLSQITHNLLTHHANHDQCLEENGQVVTGIPD